MKHTLCPKVGVGHGCHTEPRDEYSQDGQAPGEAHGATAAPHPARALSCLFCPLPQPPGLWPLCPRGPLPPASAVPPPAEARRPDQPHLQNSPMYGCGLPAFAHLLTLLPTTAGPTCPPVGGKLHIQLARRCPII